ncbi:MAG: hypothetical protein IT359_10945 [Gemmatimonadaceae bacterium]|nr:hypothetical protein [Gemmatimonadaceae bacterium]
MALSPCRLAAQISPGALARPHASLEGTANCVKCHGLKGNDSPMTQVCLQCHKEIGWLMQQQRGLHAREVRVSKKECASCHPDHAGLDFKMVEWPEGSPNKFDHRKSGWPLDGKHIETKCDACHATKYRSGPAATLSVRKVGAGWVGLERNCLSCHKEDDAHDGKLDEKCETCHETKAWDKAPKFDHDKADYRLDGKHTDVECDKCHLTARLKLKVNADGDRVPLFKPVPYKECSACHEDPHKGRLSTKCSECHSTKGFDAIDKRDFNHALTRYPLKGDHVTVPCAECHGKDMSRKSPSFATCASCHADAHNGEATLGGKSADCAACHKVDGFAPSTFTVAQHRDSRYALEGKHLSVKCALCHVARSATASSAATAPPALAAPLGAGAVPASLARSSKVVRIRMPAGKCADCHQDVHGGAKFTSVATSTCESCHAVSGFAPSTYAREAHARLRLPLDGKHATITCAACHGATRSGLPPWPAAVLAARGKGKMVLAGVDPACTSCHVDPHAGRYSHAGGAAGDGTCRSCHGADSFRPSRVDVQLHATYALALEGAHRAVPCVACHEEMKAGSTSGSTLVGNAKAVASLPFTAASRRSCVTCHETPHGTQFASRKGGDDCATCHGVDGFAPASRFDHEQSAFSLKGAHATVACDGCHKREPVTGGAPGATRVVYRPLSPKCESCHSSKSGKPTTSRFSAHSSRGESRPVQIS